MLMRHIFTDILERVIRKAFTPEQILHIAKKLAPWQRNLIEKLFMPSQKQIIDIRRRLYNLGFTDCALDDLQKLVSDNSKPHLRRLAAWELALWHANQYNWENANKCLEYLPIVTQGEKNKGFLRQAAIIEAECHDILGNVEVADSIISRSLDLERHGDLFIAAANLKSSIPNRIKCINMCLQLYGIPKISFNATNNHQPFGCLVPAYDTQKLYEISNDAPKVTVIMPAYNAETVIKTALNSLLIQTWTKTEILVVDDCSTDSTMDIIEEYAKRDSRVKLIRAESNGGPYVARNLALKIASGDFVTCHDADDWSHPEKIERQVRHLLNNPSVIGNSSQQARATDDLKFYRRGNPGFYIFNNMSSFMFRREPVMEALGYWDCVRFGADSELIRRIMKVFGNEAVVEIPTGPLSFQRQSKDSLTGDGAFGYHGFFMGARKEYLESQKYYHTIAGSLRYEFPQGSRPFAIPEPMWPNREIKNLGRRHFDVILVSDFRLDGGSNISNIEEIKAQKQMGLRTGLIQMSRYDYDPRKKTNPKIRELLDNNQVQMIVYGEKASCDLLIIRHPPILQEWQRFVPNVQTDNVCVIVNQTPMSDYGADAVLRYDIRRCRQHLEKYFGKPGIWYPIGPLVRDALYQYHSKELTAITLANENWVNIIDVDEWRRTSRPQRRSKTWIGRHTRDSLFKWPTDPDELLAIYPDSSNYEIHILGGADTPQKILGRLPKNWHVLEFGEVHPKDFLSTLDVFVYYTHSDLVEAFGRVIIEAMAVGVPVILPPRFRKVFGAAAIYAEPPDVKMNIDRLMSDNDYYRSQVEKAWQYVETHFGYSKHASRLAEFIDKPYNKY